MAHRKLRQPSSRRHLDGSSGGLGPQIPANRIEIKVQKKYFQLLQAVHHMEVLEINQRLQTFPLGMSRQVKKLTSLIRPSSPSAETAARVQRSTDEWMRNVLNILKQHYDSVLADGLGDLPPLDQVALDQAIAYGKTRYKNRLTALSISTLATLVEGGARVSSLGVSGGACLDLAVHAEHWPVLEPTADPVGDPYPSRGSNLGSRPGPDHPNPRSHSNPNPHPHPNLNLCPNPHLYPNPSNPEPYPNPHPDPSPHPNPNPHSPPQRPLSILGGIGSGRIIAVTVDSEMLVQADIHSRSEQSCKNRIRAELFSPSDHGVDCVTLDHRPTFDLGSFVDTGSDSPDGVEWLETPEGTLTDWNLGMDHPSEESISTENIPSSLPATQLGLLLAATQRPIQHLRAHKKLRTSAFKRRKKSYRIC